VRDIEMVSGIVGARHAVPVGTHARELNRMRIMLILPSDTGITYSTVDGTSRSGVNISLVATKKTEMNIIMTE
jgi:hypothetical protein